MPSDSLIHSSSQSFSPFSPHYSLLSASYTVTKRPRSSSLVPFVTPHHMLSLFSNFLASVSLFYHKDFLHQKGKKNQGPDISLTSCGNEVATFFLLCWCIDFLYHRISAVLREEWYAFAVWSLVVWLGFAPGAWYVR